MGESWNLKQGFLLPSTMLFLSARLLSILEDLRIQKYLGTYGWDDMDDAGGTQKHESEG